MYHSKFIDVSEEAQFRYYTELLDERQDDEHVETPTSVRQNCMEADVLKCYKANPQPLLARQKHIEFLKKSLVNLTERYECLDSSRPWLCYWILHSLQILGERLEDEEYSRIVDFLGRCQAPEGGFGGGPGQSPHIAPTYAAVNALCTIGTEDAYQTINRETLQHFLMSLHEEDGSFSVHVDGEIDIRGVYCALVIAKLTNIYTPEMFKGTEEWIVKCQTWEGGFGGCPGMEAHGGYTYCGLAALILLGKTDLCSLTPLLHWIVNKQMRLEGGFQGRTNKLVDCCYSFWQGGAFALTEAILLKERKLCDSNNRLFNQEALQQYLLICCQHPFGGFLDKPNQKRDIYHTCYGLSGLSLAQHSSQPIIIGPPSVNLVDTIHPVYNLTTSCAVSALKYFSALPVPD